MYSIRKVFLIFVLLALLSRCSLLLESYSTIYLGNTSTGGGCPTDSNQYENGDVVSVLPAGTLVKEGYRVGINNCRKLKRSDTWVTMI